MATRHRNDGLRKVCSCPRRQWAKCEHPWHLNYKWNGISYRFSIDRHIGERLAGKTEAKNAADGLRIAIREGRFQQQPAVQAEPTTADAITLEKFADTFLSRATPKKARDRDAWEREARWHLNRVLAFDPDGNGSRFGAKPIGAITEDDLEAFVNALRAEGRSASTRNHYIQLFSSMFRWAVKKGHLTRNPMTHDDESALRREKPARRSRRLQGDEETRLIQAANPQLQRLIIAALETACRRGELLTLQWKDVDMDRREILIRAEHAKDAESRVLPISDRLRAVLEMGKTDPAGKEFGPEAFVFGDVTGGQIQSVKKAFRGACGRCDPAITDLHFHDLRHEAASRLLEARWPIHHVQAMLGHADVSTTGTYLNPTRIGLHESMRQSDLARTGCKPVANETPQENKPLCNEAIEITDKSLVN